MLYDGVATHKDAKERTLEDRAFLDFWTYSKFWLSTLQQSLSRGRASYYDEFTSARNKVDSFLEMLRGRQDESSLDIAL